MVESLGNGRWVLVLAGMLLLLPSAWFVWRRMSRTRQQLEKEGEDNAEPYMPWGIPFTQLLKRGALLLVVFLGLVYAKFTYTRIKYASMPDPTLENMIQLSESTSTVATENLSLPVVETEADLAYGELRESLSFATREELLVKWEVLKTLDPSHPGFQYLGVLFPREWYGLQFEEAVELTHEHEMAAVISNCLRNTQIELDVRSRSGAMSLTLSMMRAHTLSALGDPAEALRILQREKLVYPDQAVIIEQQKQRLMDEAIRLAELTGDLRYDKLAVEVMTLIQADPELIIHRLEKIVHLCPDEEIWRSRLTAVRDTP